MSFIKGTWNDKATLPIKCPKCGHTTDELITKLADTNKPRICAACGKSFAINGDELATLNALKKIVEGFK